MMEYLYQCNACGELYKTKSPSLSLCKLCGYKSYTLIGRFCDDEQPRHGRASVDDRIIEIVEKYHGSGKAMQVADILKDGE